MIPIHQLRIGNYVMANGKMGRVSMLSKTSAAIAQATTPAGSATETAAEYPIENIYPVPMGDGILQDCRFVYHDYFKFWQLITGTGDTRSEMDIDRDYNVLDFMRKPIVKTVDSLHQLQNIYFTLKGKELAYREPAHS